MSGAATNRAAGAPSGAPPLPDAPLPRRFEELVATRAVSEVRLDARDVEMQRKLDAFRQAMTPLYRTPDGDIPVAAPFRMNNSYPGQEALLAKRSTQDELQSASRRAHLTSDALTRINAGRGTPEEIHALTQALIDAASRPSEGWTAAAIRQLAFDHGIGIDCAGYVQQDYLRATGRTRQEAGLSGVVDESLSNLQARGWARVASFSQVRPGDIVVLGPPPPSKPHEPPQPGHRAIVYDQRVATARDLAELIPVDRARPPDGRKFVDGTIRVFEVDSSWGCGGDAQIGGVRRETWWLNEKTGQWAYLAQAQNARILVTTPGPYGHPLEGFYRRKGD